MTTNEVKGRDPEMQQTKKARTGFRLMGPIGVYAKSGLVHTVIGNPANLSDVSQSNGILHGDERTVHGDAGYQGADKRPENEGVTDERNIAMERHKREDLPKDEMGIWLRAIVPSCRNPEELSAKLIRGGSQHALGLDAAFS